MKAYNFAALRYVHDVTTHEFINVGVIMWTPADGRVRFRVSEHYGRASSFFNDFEGATYRQLARHLTTHVNQVAEQLKNRDLFRQNPGSLGEVLDAVLRRDSTCFQWSNPSGGICVDPEARFEELFSEFVLRNEPSTPRPQRNEDAIWMAVKHRIDERGLTATIKSEVTISTINYAHTFKTGWRNGKIQVLEPVSFDLIDPRSIVEKANTWAGRLFTLTKANEFAMTAVLARPQRESAMAAFNRGYAILKDAPAVRQLLSEDEVSDFLEVVRSEIDSH